MLRPLYIRDPSIRDKWDGLKYMVRDEWDVLKPLSIVEPTQYDEYDVLKPLYILEPTVRDECEVCIYEELWDTARMLTESEAKPYARFGILIVFPILGGKKDRPDPADPVP